MADVPIFYDTLGPTATGTGVARAQLGGALYTVPAAARELVGVYSFVTAEAPDPADSIVGVFDIIGSDFKYQPCEWLGPVASGKLGAIDQLETTPMQFWPIHAPLNGNEKLDVGYEPCSAIASDGEAGVTFVFSTMRTGKPVIHGKFSREVATGTTVSTDTPLTDLSISGARKMLEVVGVMVSGTGTVVADEECAGRLTVKCTQWDPIQSIRFFHEPMHAIEATSGCTKVKAITKLPFNARFKSPQATIQANAINDDALSNAGVYVYGVRYLGL